MKTPIRVTKTSSLGAANGLAVMLLRVANSLPVEAGEAASSPIGGAVVSGKGVESPKKKRLDHDDPFVRSADRDGDGYTSVEEYIDGLVPKQPVAVRQEARP